MKNKLYLFFLLILFISIFGYTKISFTIGPSVAMFNSGDEILKEVYGGNKFIYGLKFGADFWQGFGIWFSGYQYNEDSKVSYTEEPIRFNSTTYGMYLRYMPNVKWMIRPFIGAGFIKVSYNEKGEDETVEDVSGNGNGNSFMFGFDFKIKSRFSFNLEAKYDNVIVNPTGFNVQLGGFSLIASFLFKII